jgi:hypothetical protein
VPLWNYPGYQQPLQNPPRIVEAMPEPGTTSNKLIVQNESTTKKRKVEAHKITDSACDKLKTTGFDGMPHVV